jgi:phosphatidylserine/phosphatidylglycerophosphate/cardiolipin synthase-like enzyme
MPKDGSIKGTSLSFPDLHLLGDGPAVVIGIPRSFDLRSEIASANTIRLATAFARPAGWKMLAPSIAVSKAKPLRLLTGRSFFLTHPDVLRDWSKLSESGKVEAKLYHPEKGITFHPKVLVVEGQRNFAIVGSGNLSLGGLHTNIECAVFVESSAFLTGLCEWFDTVFFSGPAKPLRDKLVSEYARTWNRLRKPLKDFDKQRQQLEEEYIARTAFMKHWDNAVSEAKRYLNSADLGTPGSPLKVATPM